MFSIIASISVLCAYHKINIVFYRSLLSVGAVTKFLTYVDYKMRITLDNMCHVGIFSYGTNLILA